MLLDMGRRVKIVRSTIAVLLAVLFTVLSFWDDSLLAKADEKADLSLSGDLELCMNHDKKDMEKYLKGFREKYPNVNLTYSTYADYEKTMTERIVNGDYGDVLLIPSSLAYNKIPSAFLPIGTVEQLSEKYNYMENCYSQNGQVYGLTSFAYLHGIIYNKAVFEQAGVTKIPTSMEEYHSAMRQIKEHSDAIPLYTNYTTTWAISYWNTFPFIEMNGASGYKYNEFLREENPFEQGSSYWQVFRLLYDMVKDGYTEKIPTAYEWSDTLKKLNRGEIASMISGSWAVQQTKYAGSNGADIGFMPFPNTVDGKQYVTVGFDYNYGISSKTKNREAAEALLQYLIEDSGYALGTGNISIVKTDPYPEYINEMDQFTMLYDVSPTGSTYEIWDALHKYVVPGSTDEILRIVDAAAGISEESFDAIMEDWSEKWAKGREDLSSRQGNYTSERNGDEYQNTVVSVDNSNVALSNAEKKYIEEKKMLRVGYLRTWAPFSFETKDGQFTGLLRNITDQISEETGLTMEYVGFDSMMEMITMLENGELDLIAGVEMSFPMAKIKYSKSFFTFLDVYVISPNVDITHIQDYIYAVPNDFPVVETDTIKKYDNIKKCIEAVERERANYTTANYYTANYYFKDLGCTMAEIAPASKYSSMHYAFAENVDNSLVAIVNKVLYTIPDEDLQVQILEYTSPVDSKFTVEKFVRTNPIGSVMIVIFFSLFLIVGISIILFQKEKSNREQSLAVKKYRMLANLADEYMFEYNIAKQEFMFDAKFQKTFQFPLSTSWQVDKDVEQLHRFVSKMDQFMKNSESAEIPFELEKENGERNWFRVMVSIMEDDNKNPIYWIGKMVNVQKEMEEMQIYQEKAEKDSLTQVYNRHGFYDQLPKTAEKVLFAVIDLDNFKSVNDHLGHSGGDEVLKILSEQLNRNMGEHAVVGRYGGDEFVCCLHDISLNEAEDRLKWLVKCMDTNVNVQGLHHVISISVGAVYSESIVMTANLFEQADEALYEKKNNGKNGYLIKQIS